ncbi:hypothetical protein LTS18_002296, partial [Coniosporium uncinatum]
MDPVDRPAAVSPTSPVLPEPASKAVRFSSDVTRTLPAQENEQEPIYGRRNQGPPLSLNTSGGSQHGSSRMRSPIQAVSPKSSGSTPPPPRSRNRGYSLRRALFNRNMIGSSEQHSSVIELQEAGSSRQDRPGPSSRDSKGSTKPGSGDAVVTISSMMEDDDVHSRLASKDLKHKSAGGLSSLPHYESWMLHRARHSAYLKKLKAVYTRMRKVILRIQEIPPSKDGRHIELDASRKRDLVDERTNKPYIGNTIRSSRYTVWNFLPRQLFFQFSKLANAYFLSVSIMQMIPGL